MNHWFLCARDLMWFVLAMAPLFLSSYYGWLLGKNEDTINDFDTLFFAIFIQVVGIVCLYTGAIK